MTENKLKHALLCVDRLVDALDGLSLHDRRLVLNKLKSRASGEHTHRTEISRDQMHRKDNA